MKERQPIVIWGDPPARTGGAGLGRAIAIEPELRRLKERPGQWARIATREGKVAAARLVVSITRTKRARALGPFEAVSRIVDVDDDSYGVWARYVGEKLAEEAA